MLDKYSIHATDRKEGLTMAGTDTDTTNNTGTATGTDTGTSTNTKEAQDSSTKKLIETPHGVQESIKMDLLEMIQEGTEPFEIIYAVARYLETASAERGYAQHIIDNIRTIYGTALREQKPLADEIAALESRRQRIQDYLDSTKKDDTVSEEERARLNFSIKAHERKIERLKGLLQCKA